jgi:PAS domain S-box-containing protein
MLSRILVIDDEENIRYTFKSFLSDEGYQVTTVGSLQEGRDLLAQQNFDLVFLDILLGRESGLDILREVRQKGLPCLVVMITGAPDVETAAEAVRYGAFDYIPKPVQQQNLLRVARAALEHKALLQEKETFRLRLEGLFRCAREGIFITDRELRIVEMNDAARRIFQCEDAVVGKTFDELGDSREFATLKKFCDIVRSRFEGEIYRIEDLAPDGVSRLLSLTSSPLTTEDGADYGYVLVVREESEASG